MFRPVADSGAPDPAHENTSGTAALGPGDEAGDVGDVLSSAANADPSTRGNAAAGSANDEWIIKGTREETSNASSAWSVVRTVWTRSESAQGRLVRSADWSADRTTTIPLDSRPALTIRVRIPRGVSDSRIPSPAWSPGSFRVWAYEMRKAERQSESVRASSTPVSYCPISSAHSTAVWTEKVGSSLKNDSITPGSSVTASACRWIQACVSGADQNGAAPSPSGLAATARGGRTQMGVSTKNAAITRTITITAARLHDSTNVVGVDGVLRSRTNDSASWNAPGTSCARRSETIDSEGDCVTRWFRRREDDDDALRGDDLRDDDLRDRRRRLEDDNGLVAVVGTSSSAGLVREAQMWGRVSLWVMAEPRCESQGATSLRVCEALVKDSASAPCAPRRAVAGGERTRSPAVPEVRMGAWRSAASSHVSAAPIRTRASWTAAGVRERSPWRTSVRVESTISTERTTL